MAEPTPLPALPQPPRAVGRAAALAPTPAQALARDAFGRTIAEPEPEPEPAAAAAPAEPQPGAASRRGAATEAIGRRAGALSDELAFPEFVASLIHGTFDAIVDSSVRQMESFASLVAAVAKPLERFTQEDVTLNQARDWLVEQFPRDVTLSHDADGFRVVPRQAAGEGEDGEPPSPPWLADFGLAGEPLTAELIEEQLLPRARERAARQRLQMLATMVLLGMNRVVVKDGTIGARLRFRATAADRAKVDYARSDDPGSVGEWGSRGGRVYAQPRTMVSTVGVNVQTDAELKAELFGEVKINFASETLPLDRFADEARRTLLERHARAPNGPAAVAAAPAAPAVALPAPQPAPQPAAPAAAPAIVASPAQPGMPAEPAGAPALPPAPPRAGGAR